MDSKKFIIILVATFILGIFSHWAWENHKSKEKIVIDTPVTLALKKSFDSLLGKVSETNLEISGIKDRQNKLLDSLVKIKTSTNEEKKQVRNFTPTSKSRWLDSLERANNLK